MRIFLFRGLLGDAFSTGMDRLADKLEDDGHTVSVHRWMNRKKIQRRFLKDEHNGQQVGVIGHSLGGNAALAMANRFSEKGVDVRYLATLDPTVRGTVDGQIPAADNFRSRDIRDKPIDGAVEHNRPDLNHIQIDKDSQVHDQIIAQCTSTFADASAQDGSSDMSMSDQLDRLEDLGNIEGLQTALAAIIGSGGLKGSQTDGELASVIKLIAEELGSDGVQIVEPNANQLTDEKPELTPVNAALGESVGNALNGKKTGLGIIGLLGTAILPTLFPQAAPIVSLLQALGLGPEMVQGAAANADKVQETPNLLTPVFAALTGWGVLGKIDKWVAGLKKVK